MKNTEFVEKLIDIAKNHKTLYVMGCFGAPLQGTSVDRYSKNHVYNINPYRSRMIRAAADQSPPVYGFDCVCLIKGVLWGWRGDKDRVYGGAVYLANDVPDIGANSMIKRCLHVSTTGWGSLVPGEALWTLGHIGVYIGDGLAIECTPRWGNNVQITAVGNIGARSGYPTRKWSKHGLLPWVDYSESATSPGDGSTYTVKKGDSPWSIAALELGDGRRYKEIEQLNGLTGKYFIYAGQVLKLPQSAATPAPTSYKARVTAQKGLNFRSGPGVNYAKRGAFNAGQVVTISKEQSGWGYVSGSGWVSLDYIKKV